MTKKFFEIFPELKMEQTSTDLFRDVDITRIAMSRAKDAMCKGQPRSSQTLLITDITSSSFS